MSVSTPTAPVADLEAKLKQVVPPEFRPALDALVAQANAAERAAIDRAPDERAKADAVDPALSEAARDAAAFSRGAVPSGVVKLAPALVREVKAGYKTTEFWISAAVIILTQVGAFHLPGKYGDTITTTAAASAYVVSRGLAKIGR